VKKTRSSRSTILERCSSRSASCRCSIVSADLDHSDVEGACEHLVTIAPEAFAPQIDHID
jgi:hypothetical protein